MSYAYWEQSRTRPDEAVITREPGPTQGPPPAPAPSGKRRAKSPRASRRREPVQLFAGAVGLVFILVGILGFVPKITTMFGDFGVFGRSSKSELLGLFQVSALHNVVHLLFGVGVLAAAKAESARIYLIVGGVLYGIVGLFGSLIDRSGSLNFLPFNRADNILHFALAAGMILLGVIGGLLLSRNTKASVAAA